MDLQHFHKYIIMLLDYKWLMITLVVIVVLLFAVGKFDKKEQFMGMIVSDDVGTLSKLDKDVAVSVQTSAGPKDVFKVRDDGTIEILGNLIVNGSISGNRDINASGNINGNAQLNIKDFATIGPAYVGVGENPDWAQFSHKDRNKLSKGGNEGLSVLKGNIDAGVWCVGDGRRKGNFVIMTESNWPPGAFMINGQENTHNMSGELRTSGPAVIQNAWIGNSTADWTNGKGGVDHWVQFRHAKNASRNAGVYTGDNDGQSAVHRWW